LSGIDESLFRESIEIIAIIPNEESERGREGRKGAFLNSSIFEADESEHTRWMIRAFFDDIER